ncbi:phosphatidylglycerophosphatase A [Pelagibacteraceae bacterium]|nr:phosphatidylglycerophosphatase A [Pelagibacteraceae bacterium]
MFSLAKIFTTFFYLGYFPIAPGTIGSIVAIILWWSVLSANFLYFLAFFLLYIIFSYIFTHIHLNEEKKDDPSEIICDEVIGQFIPLFIISSTNDIYLILIAFVSFRIFDIYKLYPANYAETMHGANGVIIDDVIAGIYALIIVFIFKYLLSL